AAVGNARPVPPSRAEARRAYRRDPRRGGLRHRRYCQAAPGGCRSMMLRSLLYVPASSDKFLARAHERGADGLILDLEDAVSPAEKPRARAQLREAVPSAARNGATIFVRINALATGLALDDAQAAAEAGAFGLFVPKVHEADDLAQIAAHLDAVERGRKLVLVALLEDAAAVLDARQIATGPRLFALATGGEDLATDMGA